MPEYKIRWRWEGESVIDAPTYDDASEILHDAFACTNLYGVQRTFYPDDPEFLGAEKDGHLLTRQQINDESV